MAPAQATTRRIFLPWDEPALPAAARVLADRHADAVELPLGGAVVGLPGARAGRRLTELLVDEAEARGLALTPPRITTVGGLPELLYEPDRPAARPPLARRAWVRALRSIAPEARTAVFPDPPSEEEVAPWAELAGLVQRLHRELAGEGLSFSDVAAACGEGGGFDDGDRWRALAEAQRAYHRRLEELGYADRHSARLAALEQGAVATDRSVYLVGVVELPAVVRSVLSAVDGEVVALVHAPRARADGFDELGCVRPEAWAGAEIEIREEAIVQCGRPPSQADEVVRTLSGEGRRLAPDEVSVGVPDGDVVPYLEQRLAAYGVPHRYAAGTPLPRTDPYRLLSAVAEYLDGARFADLASLLRHPAVQDRLGPDAPEVADRHFEERLPERVGPGPAGRAGPEGPGRFRRLLRSLEEHLALERLRGQRELGEWMPEILSLLDRAYGHRALDRSSPVDRRLVETCETLRDAAASLHRLPATLDEACRGAEAIRLLLTEVREEAVPPLPDRSAVEMLGWLELHLDDAPVLVLTGFQEDCVPGSVNADLFLPNALRSRLGLVDNRHRYGRDAYLLSAILASREEVRVLVGRRDADGNPQRPSRLLLAASGRRLAERARRLFGDEVPSRASVPRLGVEPAGESSFRTPPEPRIEVPDPPDRLRVTDFRLLLEDPYRFVLEEELGLEEEGDHAREMDALRFGVLAHEVLHRFGESPEAASADAEAVRSRLEGLLDRVVGKRLAADVLPAVRLQVEQLRARLRDFAEWQACRVQEGWEIVGVEIETPPGGSPFDVDGEPVHLTGRIDRVDRHRGAGTWEILDYKTSGEAKAPEATHRRGRAGSKRWVDLQLPLYRHLVPTLADAGRLPEEITDPEARVEVGYVSLSREGVDRSIATWSDEALASADDAAREAVRLLRSGAVEYREERTRRSGGALASLLGRARLVGHERAGSGPAGGRAGEEGDAP